ncbi:MAG: L,D-transpeptidase, partial [Anaerolineales bacterium]
MPFSRRDFIKLAGGAAAALALAPYGSVLSLGDFPQSARLGRLTTTADLRSAPRIDFPVMRELPEDTVIPVLREVIGGEYGTETARRSHSRTWLETDAGFVHKSVVQPVKNVSNEPLREIPAGKLGFWAEVTVPYVDFSLENDNPASPWLKNAVLWQFPTRLYYSQIMWVDQIKVSDVTGQVLYRVTERYGGYNDIFWAEGAAFRPITEEEIAPIYPDVDPAEKKIYANLTYQTISCYESGREVYFCHMSSGLPFDSFGNFGVWSTPLGTHWTWRKSISIHMASGTARDGWDIPGVSWTTLFSGTGVAIHSTFWHNNFGHYASRGCLNVAPEDAKWIFR